MIRIRSLTGLRPDEVVRMRAGDLNMTGQIGDYRPGTHKLDHQEEIERVVMIGPRAQEILKPWLRTDLGPSLFDPRDSLADHRAEWRAGRKTPLWPSHAAAQARKRRDRPARAQRDHDDLTSYRHAIHRGCDAAFPHPDLSSLAEKDLTDDQRAERSAWRKAHRRSPNHLRHSAATSSRLGRTRDYFKVTARSSKASWSLQRFRHS